jgi:hypothetical protein
MRTTDTYRRLVAVGLAILLGSAACAFALIVSLDVYVEFGILDENNNPLADGMTVLVVGTT